MVTKSVRCKYRVRKTKVRNNKNKTNVSRKRNHSKKKKKTSRQKKKKSLRKKRKISKKKRKIIRGGVTANKTQQSHPREYGLQVCKVDDIKNTYKREGVLEKGSYSTVWKAHIISKPHTYVAIKKIIKRKDIDDNQFISEIKSEIDILSELSKKQEQSDKVMKYHECYYDDEKKAFYIVTEYIEGIELFYLINMMVYTNVEGMDPRLKDFFFNLSNTDKMKLILDIINQILDGLIFLHNNQITHLDLKPENIMIILPNIMDLTIQDDIKVTVKIIDFGFACLQNKTTLNCDFPLGTIPYMHPLLIELYSNKNDISVTLNKLGISKDTQNYPKMKHELLKYFDYWAFGQLIVNLLYPHIFDPVNNERRITQNDKFNKIYQKLYQKYHSLPSYKKEKEILHLLLPLINPNPEKFPKSEKDLNDLNQLYLDNLQLVNVAILKL